MNFIDWDTYEKEVARQILSLWENYEKDITIDDWDLNKLVKNEIRSFSARQEVVLKLIDRIKLQATATQNHTPNYFALPTVPLLEYKWEILPPEFLEDIAISDETRGIVDIISHQAPQSIIRNNKILDAMKQDTVDYGRFLEYITERTEMRNPVEGINPEYELSYKTIQTIEERLDAHIFIGDMPMNPDAFIQELILLDKKFDGKISWRIGIITNEVFFENPNITHPKMADLMIVGSLSEHGYPTIVGIYFLRNQYSIARLYSHLSGMMSKYPEAALYYRYIYENIEYLVNSK